MEQASQARVALRNRLLVWGRRAGWTTIADAVRATTATVGAALSGIGAAVTFT